MSSAFMVPLIERLAAQAQAQVNALDTPGYGNSDPLPEPGDDLNGYVQWLKESISALGFTRVGLYGSATGAQIAIAFANAHPELLHYLILDNAAHFEPAERDRILQNYLPDLSPQPDGRHLQTIWKIATGLYQWFPWYQQDEAHRVGPPNTPPALINATALEYMRAGTDYGRAYRAAFMHEDAKHVQRIQVPVRVIRWQGSILRKYTDRYDQFTWPDNIQMRHCDASIDARYQTICKAVAELQESV